MVSEGVVQQCSQHHNTSVVLATTLDVPHPRKKLFSIFGSGQLAPVLKQDTTLSNVVDSAGSVTVRRRHGP